MGKILFIQVSSSILPQISQISQIFAAHGCRYFTDFILISQISCAAWSLCHPNSIAAWPLKSKENPLNLCNLWSFSYLPQITQISQIFAAHGCCYFTDFILISQISCAAWSLCHPNRIAAWPLKSKENPLNLCNLWSFSYSRKLSYSLIGENIIH